MTHKATVFDVAAYILEQMGECTHMKLQKLVYYAQAWSLVWDDKPLFKSKIEAWANGPVVPQLYVKLRGKYRVSLDDLPPTASAEHLSESQKQTIDCVLNFYKDKSPQWLSDLTHAESPWIEARRGLPAGERGSKEIKLASMVEYYSSL